VHTHSGFKHALDEVLSDPVRLLHCPPLALPTCRVRG
jgi:hypothetical protein